MWRWISSDRVLMSLAVCCALTVGVTMFYPNDLGPDDERMPVEGGPRPPQLAREEHDRFDPFAPPAPKVIAAPPPVQTAFNPDEFVLVGVFQGRVRTEVVLKERATGKVRTLPNDQDPVTITPRGRDEVELRFNGKTTTMRLLGAQAAPGQAP